MLKNDFLPEDPTEFAEWLESFASRLPAFSEKYSLSDAELNAVSKDSRWLKYWVRTMTDARLQEKQLTDYIDRIAGGERCRAACLSAPASAPSAAAAPPAVAPGIKTRIRQIVQRIKSSRRYTPDDGQALGISRAVPIADLALKPEFSARTLPNYGIELTFKKRAADAVRVEFQRARPAWQTATILSTSPGAFMIAPSALAQAEQIELRCIYLKHNRPFGAYSDIRTALIAP